MTLYLRNRGSGILYNVAVFVSNMVYYGAEVRGCVVVELALYTHKLEFTGILNAGQFDDLAKKQKTK